MNPTAAICHVVRRCRQHIEQEDIFSGDSHWAPKAVAWTAKLAQSEVFLTNLELRGDVTPHLLSEYYHEVENILSDLRYLITTSILLHGKIGAQNEQVNSKVDTSSQATEARTQLGDWASLGVAIDSLFDNLSDATKRLSQTIAEFSYDRSKHQELRDHLTILTLWTSYEQSLYQALVAKVREQKLPWTVPIVIRRYLLDPKRLTTIQQRLIEMNVLRRERLLRIKTNGTVAPFTEVDLNSNFQERLTDKPTGLQNTKDIPRNVIEDNIGFTSTILATPAYTHSVGPRGTIDYPSMPCNETCPICDHHLEANTWPGPKHWRKHVDGHVTPYSCIFEECSWPTSMYASAKAWIAHMEQHHSGTQWICYACSPSEPRIFVNRQAYLHHFSVTRQHEGQENESQLRQLVELTMIPAPLNFTNCPLCRWSESAEPYSFQLTTIQDHIANHLHAFAFRSLPEPEVDQSLVLSKESAVADDSSLNSSCYSFSNNDSEFSEGSSKARNDDEHLGVEEDWSYISNRQPVVNEPPLELIMKDSSRSTPDLVMQEPESPNTSRNQAQMPTRSILCHFCQAIADFFYNLDLDLASKEFPFHRTRRDVYTSARLGCPLCTEFMKSIIEGSEEILDLSSVGPERDQSANTSFTVFFTGMQQDRRLELRDVCDPSSPIYKFELYCDRSAPAKLLQWTNLRSTFQDFGSPSAIEFMKKRFSVCRQSHYNCSVYRASPPARLLDLGDNEFIETIRVVNPKQSGGPPIEFAFLSATWGLSPAFRLTQQSYAEAKQGIILERIPRTIGNAVYLTRALGLRYLWVDSLCILQDSIEDWQEEVSMMPSYLSSSAITLAATSSASLADGFLLPRAISRGFIFPMKNPETISHLEVLLRPSLPSAWESLQGDPLMKRLWCLQEVTLSPRVIHFGSSRLVWSCGTMTCADDSDTDKLPMWSEHLKLDYPWKSGNTTPTSAVYEMWHNLVSYASRLKTTMKRDRLPALSALASMAASKLEADIYLAGIWRNNLVRDLLWRRESQTLRDLDIHCPSWTWASYGGAITFQLLNAESKSDSRSSTQRSDGEGWETSKRGKVSLLDTVEANFIPMAEVVDAKTSYIGSNRFGEVTMGTIHLKTFYVPYASIDKLFGESLVCKRTMVDVLERNPDRFTTFDDTSFAILGRCGADMPMSETWHGLLLRDVGDRTYARVGVSAVGLMEGLDDNHVLWRDLEDLRQTRMIV